MKKQFLIFLLLVPFVLKAQNHFIQGLLIDAENQNPVDYANIGIEGKNLGTVSNDSGYFELEISDEFLEDSLTFSRIGYSTKKLTIKELVQNNDLTITLNSKSTEIHEAKIISNKLKRITKGNVSRSKNVIFAAYNDSVRLGGEICVLIRLPKKPILIKDFNFHITKNTADSVKFRFNLYNGSKGVIGENLLKENIYFTLYKDDIGDFKLNLNENKIYAFEDVFIALEIVDIYSNKEKSQSNEKKSDINLSGTLIGARGAYTEVSHGEWKSLPATISPGFWITILK